MKNLLFLVFLAFVITSNAQVAINTDGSLPDNSSMLDVKSSSKGMLVPRMTTAQRTAIVSPAAGLLVFDNTTNSFWFYGAAAWKEITTGSNGWNLNGNSGTDTTVNFIGTTDNMPLAFRVNNQAAGKIDQGLTNTSLGCQSLTLNTTGTANTAFGTATLYNNATGTFNTAAGINSLYNNISGSYNTGVGARSLQFTTGSFNTAVGASALRFNTFADNNTAVGFNALQGFNVGQDNTGIGAQALFANTLGVDNTAVGTYSLSNNTTGAYNTAMGSVVLTSNSTGNNNTATGYQSLYSNSIGNNNTANGFKSLYSNSDGGFNTADGYMALFSNEYGAGNTACGTEALFANTGGNGNTAVGNSALVKNNSGSSNTAVGENSLFLNTSGYSNTAIGESCLYSNTTGYSNTSFGNSALSYNTGGNNNIAIGVGSGTSLYAPNIYNTVSIGNNDILNGYQNQVFLGNTSTAWIGGKVTWSTYSDARIKNNITGDVVGLAFITRLRPVTYHISNRAIVSITGNKETPDFPGKYDNEKVKYSGFIAQDVEQAAKTSGYDFSGYTAPRNDKELYTLSYEQFVVPLVKAVQEQQKMIEDRDAASLELKRTVDDLSQQVAQLKQLIEKSENK